MTLNTSKAKQDALQKMTQNSSDASKYERFYHHMMLIRRFEEKVGQAYGAGKVAGFCHLYIGQEAVIVGLVSAAIEGDKHITSYRDHGHMLALDVDPNIIMAELTGKATGCSKGKGGSMHMFAPDKHFYGGHGIVGAQVSLGTGLAFADKYSGNNNVTYVYYGDGAAHQGQVYESFNMAKLWNLPVIYVIENNEYAMGTSVERSTAVTDLYKRGESFGIPGFRVDGMDVFAVEKLSKELTERVRNGGGPVLIEVKTYRYRGHSMSDPAKYRSKEEVQEYKDLHDPITKLANYLMKEHQYTEEQLEEIDKKVRAIVAESIKFSDESPEPDESELYTDV